MSFSKRNQADFFLPYKHNTGCNTDFLTMYIQWSLSDWIVATSISPQGCQLWLGSVPINNGPINPGKRRKIPSWSCVGNESLSWCITNAAVWNMQYFGKSNANGVFLHETCCLCGFEMRLYAQTDILLYINPRIKSMGGSDVCLYICPQFSLCLNSALLLFFPLHPLCKFMA